MSKTCQSEVYFAQVNLEKVRVCSSHIQVKVVNLQIAKLSSSVGEIYRTKTKSS